MREIKDCVSDKGFYHDKYSFYVDLSSVTISCGKKEICCCKHKESIIIRKSGYQYYKRIKNEKNI